jgi:hypothetical protein
MTVLLDEETHIYTGDDGKPIPFSVTQVLELAGIVTPYPDIPIVQFHVEQARRLGSCTHRWARFIDESRRDGELVDAASAAILDLDDTDLLPYVTAYCRFLAQYDVNWEFIELGFSREDCGGTPDRVGVVDGRPTILDIKTSKAVYRHWQLQLSGYKWMAMAKNDCELTVLHLFDNGLYEVLPYEADLVTWYGALNVARWKSRSL